MAAFIGLPLVRVARCDVDTTLFLIGVNLLLMTIKHKLGSNSSRIGQASERLNAGGSWRSDKVTANARGYDYRWQCYRLQWLAEHPLCAIHGNGCTTAGIVVDHIRPHRGDMVLFWEPTNHQTTCKHCHDVHKARIERNA